MSDKPVIDHDKIADGLHAERVGHVRTGSGWFGALRAVGEVQARTPRALWLASLRPGDVVAFVITDDRVEEAVVVEVRPSHVDVDRRPNIHRLDRYGYARRSIVMRIEPLPEGGVGAWNADRAAATAAYHRALVDRQK